MSLLARVRDWRGWPWLWGWLGREVWLAAELAALCGFVFARPVLGSFGASPETFISRGMDGREVVLFGLAVLLVPLLALAVPAALVGLARRQARLVLHLVMVGGLGAVATVQLLRLNTDLGSGVVWLVAVLGGGGLLVLRWRVEVAETFLRYAGLASLVFLVQFLAFSPVSSLVFGGRSVGLDGEVAAAVHDAVGDDAPPVVMIVLDALPTASLLDGEGNIHADAYPNLARLAADSTWYRNHTTVAQDTVYAVPTILSGSMPTDRDPSPVASAYPRNLFTLLGGVYDMQVEEQVTALCPRTSCPDAADGALRPLFGDARDLWGQSLEGRDSPPGLPGAFEERYDDFARWIETRDFSRSADPSLFFYHAMFPHEPWDRLPTGHAYGASMPAYGSWAGSWGPFGADVGAQRHVLQTQAVDGLLGWMFDRMREAGVYDDALIVVTADHGAAFVPEAPQRGLAEEQFDQIMWTPLIVKEPGQAEGVVDDRNVQSVDVLPTIADSLGIDLAGDAGWDVDGLVADDASGRDPGDKAVLDWEWGRLRAAEGETMVPVDGREGFERVLDADMIEGTGELATWQRTAYGELLGRRAGDGADEGDGGAGDGEGDGGDGDVAVGDPLDGTVEVAGLDRFDDVDLAVPLGLEIQGTSWLPEDEVVAVTVNGTVAALTQPVQTEYGVSSLHALLWPEPFVDGHNEIAFYQVEGSPEDPTLHQLEVLEPSP